MAGADQGPDYKEQQTQHLHCKAFTNPHQRAGSTAACDYPTDTKHDSAYCRGKADGHDITLARNLLSVYKCTVFNCGEADGGYGECNQNRTGNRR